MSEEKALVKQQAIIEFGAVSPGAMIPKNFEGLYRMAEIMAASGLMPKGIDTPPAVFVAVQMGLEVGLSPMQAVQNIAVINNRPCMWGDAVLALVRASGLLEDFDEMIDGTGDGITATCTAIRKGQSKPIIRKFSMGDAKQAELATKSGPWKQYPKRMLQMRARSWALRDGFGDVLKGLHVAEEVQDYDVEMRQSRTGHYVQEMDASDIDPPSIDETFTAQFEKSIAEMGLSFSELDLFVQAVAEKHKMTATEVKQNAVKDAAKFLAAFKKDQAKKVKIEKPEKPSILCPAQKRGVLPAECLECQDRINAGCDAFAAWEFDENQK